MYQHHSKAIIKKNLSLEGMSLYFVRRKFLKFFHNWIKFRHQISLKQKKNHSWECLIFVRKMYGIVLINASSCCWFKLLQIVVNPLKIDTVIYVFTVKLFHYALNCSQWCYSSRMLQHASNYLQNVAKCIRIYISFHHIICRKCTKLLTHNVKCSNCLLEHTTNSLQFLQRCITLLENNVSRFKMLHCASNCSQRMLWDVANCIRLLTIIVTIHIKLLTNGATNVQHCRSFKPRLYQFPLSY